jgi:hypothetical protein
MTGVFTMTEILPRKTAENFMLCVIPGRALRANPESITPVFAFSINIDAGFRACAEWRIPE